MEGNRKRGQKSGGLECAGDASSSALPFLLYQFREWLTMSWERAVFGTWLQISERLVPSSESTLLCLRPRSKK